MFRENRYAVPVVKVQNDRGHTVVTTGPYRFVRHPMYASDLVAFLATPLLLGSWLGLALALVLIVLVAVRTLGEETALKEQLDGYARYAADVRYRLVPLIW